MIELPSIVPRDKLTCYWFYRDEKGQHTALVVRYDGEDNEKQKKWFHQFHLSESGEWREGALTPSPLFGLDTLPQAHYEGSIHILEGEKCTRAAHHLGLAALTSMMGACQANNADWAILAKFRHVKRFVLLPDSDIPGKQYMEVVYHNILKANPGAEIFICNFGAKAQGDDLIDWIKSQPECPPGWDGFSPIDDPYSDYLKAAFERYTEKNLIPARDYFPQSGLSAPSFDGSPEPIEDILHDVLPCPIETLPEIIFRWISTEADLMQVPTDYLAAPLLVFLGSIIGRKRGLTLRPGNDWVEHSNLWGMSIGRPSLMKSPAMKKVIKPMLLLAARADVRFKEATKRYETELTAWKIRKKVSEDHYKKNVKNAIENTSEDGKDPAPILQMQEAPLAPTKKRYKTDDPTVEKLGELLIENPQGLLLFRDELSGWLHSFKKSGRENDRQFFLESWTGKEEFDVDRIERGSLHIPSLFLSIFGSIQPGPLAQYIRAATKGGMSDDGFIQRFQVAVWPDSPNEWKLVEGVSTLEYEKPLQEIFNILDNLSFDANGNPILLDFTPDAQQQFNEWQYNHERRLRKDNLAPHLEAHLAKYKKLLPALCLILEHLKKSTLSEVPTQISLDAINTALCWLRYFESHAMRIYGSVRNAIPKAALELIRHIKKGDVSIPFSLRDIYYGHHWSGLSDAEEVKEVLDYLQDKNYVIAVTHKTGGRPNTKYWAHPKVLENDS